MGLRIYANRGRLENMRVTPIGIASEIRAECARQRMTFTDLADRSGLHPMTISRKIGTGQRQLKIGEFIAISRALHVPPSEFFSRIEQSPTKRQAK